MKLNCLSVKIVNLHQSSLEGIDLAFDLMNSCNPHAKGSKQPVSLEYFPKLARQCDELPKYIFNLRTIDGDLLLKGKRKTVILGFATNIQSVKAVVEELLHRNLCPYKFSQDHIKILFSKIRQCDCHGLTLSSYPFYTQFAVLKQNCGLIFPSLTVLKIAKVTVVVLNNV